MRDLWRITDLKHVDPGSTPGAPGDRAATEAALPALHDRMGQFQDRLWAEARQSLLVVLQAMDAGGKDRTIKHVFAGVNPQGTRVAAFKEPTPVELAHDFLWRVHQQVPAAGEVTIFNRSHYEDVIVPAVNDQLSQKVLRHRFKLIAGFEDLLAHRQTTVVKLFLHISKDEQLRRLRERLDRPDKRWKLRPSDITTRAKWDTYQAVYQDVLSRSEGWYVIPADHKWYRNWAVSNILIETLEEMKPAYPEPQDLDGIELA